MAGISSLGIGSGLDLNSLVSSLVAAERAPTENSLNRRESRIASDLSGIGLMKSALAGFQSSLESLSDASKFVTRTASNSNSTALGVSVTNEAEVGSYNIDINTLAASQSLASGAFSSIADTVGTGTIQIQYGTITGPGFGGFTPNSEKSIQTITVDSSNNTLAGLKDHINSNDYGVTAAIINDGSGYRLTLTSDDSGAANAMEITITDTGDGNDTDNNGLSRLAYNASATNLTETQVAVDASISVNGLAIISDTNTITDVVDGVTLNLIETTTSPITVSISESNAQLSTSIRDMVDAYNDMVGTLNDLSASGGEATQAGLLAGDASLRNFTTSLRQLMTSNVTGLSGSITALSHIGVTTQLDGTLAIDESRFDTALADNPTGAMALFAPVGRATDPLIKFNSAGSNSPPGTYAIDITSFETQGSFTGTGTVDSLQVQNNNNELTVVVDGTSSGNVTLTNGIYADEDALAAEIQSQINAAGPLVANSLTVTVSYDATSDRFTITSDTVGSGSTVEITAVDPQTTNDFGLDVGTGVAGTDFAGTIGGELATASGQIISNSDGFSVEVLGGATGPRGSVEYTRGFIGLLDDLLDDYIGSSDGSLVSREKGLNDSLEEISDERLALDLRMESVEARLIQQFTALDQLVAQFQTTSNFLTQQIANLPGSGQLVNNN